MNQTQASEMCGCCEGVAILTPLPVTNRPGLPWLAYRVGTYATFLKTMQARLSSLHLEDSVSYPLEGDPNPLKHLTTRTSDDPAIAWLHAWASVADVLTFYQERIANEGYLRTATERRSILELARLVGYKLRPGVAATAYLAFDMEVDSNEKIPAGTGAKSTPGPGELPQTFETVEILPARYEWNALTPRLTRPQYITFANASELETVYFAGINTNLKPNSPLLLVFNPGLNQAIFRRAASVELEVAQDRTLVILQPLAVAGETVAAIQATLARYQDLASFSVSATTQMAQRVTGMLASLAQALERPFTAVRLANRLETVLLPDLREEHAIALEGEYGRLEPWVGGLVAELEAHAHTLSESRPALRRARQPALLARGQQNGVDARLVNLVRLVSPLSQPPSNQPPNAQRLVRNMQTIFTPASDTVPRLLTRLKPAVKDTLYRTWAHAELTTPSALESIQALRVKAAPFGHNAPLRPIYDDQGAIIGYEEWPLTDIMASVRFIPDEELGSYTFNLPIDLALATTRHGQTTSETITISSGDLDPIVRTIAGVSYTITFIADGDVVTGIHIDALQQHIELTLGTAVVHIEIAGVQPFSLAPDQGTTVNDPLTGDTIQIYFAQSEQLSFYITPGQMIVPESLRHILPLDVEYDQILPESWVVIERPDPLHPGQQITLIRQVVAANTVSKAGYGITAKVTQLTLDDVWLYERDISLAVVRQTAVYAQSEPLTLAAQPLTDDIAGDSIQLDRLHDGLEAGRWVIVSGERTDIGGTSGVKGSELMMLSAVTHGLYQVDVDGQPTDLPGDKPHTTIYFPQPLAYTYQRDTVTIYGNVVKATHGETRTEVLGSGDGSQRFQSFRLKQSPLTFLSAPTPTGAETTLTVRVNDVRWPEAEDLYVLGPQDRGYITHTDDEAKTTVVFGDGRHGARLPTGAENIKAVYRQGIGKSGNVAAPKIDQLASRPLGVKGVRNPLPATGGADKEDRDQARRHTPLAVKALDRLVSVQDYADFARTFAGIGKANAVRCSDGQRELIHLTVAGADDIPIATTADLYRNLCQALRQYGDPYLPIQVDLRELVVLVISAKIRVLPDYLWETVEAGVRGALLAAFSFNGRELGQDVLLSEVISTIQHVPGVNYVDVDVLDGISETMTEDAAQLQQKLNDLSQPGAGQPRKRIPVSLACTIRGPIRPAQLALLNPDLPETLILTELT